MERERELERERKRKRRSRKKHIFFLGGAMLSFDNFCLLILTEKEL